MDGTALNRMFVIGKIAACHKSNQSSGYILRFQNAIFSAFLVYSEINSLPYCKYYISNKTITC